MKISGVMGYVILKNPKKDNYIILFSDIHDGVKYCDPENSKFIDDFLKGAMNQFSILLEEVPRLGVELVELWPGAKHTQKLKDLYLKHHQEIEGIDLRPYLVPFAYQKENYSGLEEKEKKIKMEEYLRLLNLFFNPEELKIQVKDLPYPQFFKKILELLEKLPSQSGVIDYYQRLRERFNLMKTEINLEDNFEKVLKENRNWFERLDDIKSEIMDWYTILLIYSLDNNIIVHFGLAHFVNTLSELEKLNFKIVKRNGLTSFLGNKDKACSTLNF